MRGFHTVTRRNAPRRNSVGTPPELVDLQKKKQHGSNCSWNAGDTPGWRKILRYRLFSRRFCRTESACGAVRCVMETFRDDGNYALQLRCATMLSP